MAKEKTGEEIKATTIGFSPEQMELVRSMIDAAKGSGERGSVSRYTDVRDPKKLETVKVSRFDNKFVLGFKDLNIDPYRKAPKYSENKLDLVRKLPDQPFVTLILSDGGEQTEKEVSLIDYMNNREQVQCKVAGVKEKEVIDDKGILGRQGGGGYASAVDGDGKLVHSVAVKAEVKRIERNILVEVPGFDEPVSFIEAFLA